MPKPFMSDELSYQPRGNSFIELYRWDGHRDYLCGFIYNPRGSLAELGDDSLFWVLPGVMEPLSDVYLIDQLAIDVVFDRSRDWSIPSPEEMDNVMLRTLKEYSQP